MQDAVLIKLPALQSNPIGSIAFCLFEKSFKWRCHHRRSFAYHHIQSSTHLRSTWLTDSPLFTKSRNSVIVFVQLSSNGRTGIFSMVISWKFAQGPGGPVCFLLTWPPFLPSTDRSKPSFSIFFQNFSTVICSNFWLQFQHD